MTEREAATLLKLHGYGLHNGLKSVYVNLASPAQIWATFDRVGYTRAPVLEFEWMRGPVNTTKTQRHPLNQLTLEGLIEVLTRLALLE